MKQRAVLSFVLALTMLFSVTSCASTLKISAAELSSGYSRQTMESGELTDTAEAALSAFAFRLFEATGGEAGENRLLSPLSALYCLGLIANGADGQTLTQMEAAFGLPSAELNRALYALSAALPSEKNCKVSLANSVWFRNTGLTVWESFLQANADWYAAEAYSAPFNGETLKDINNWVNLNTDGLIPKMIDEIPSDTVMYLINTLLFDAAWGTAYLDSSVSDGIFHCADGNDASVKMLRSSESTYLKTDTAVGFVKQYAGGNYSFVALLPDEGTSVESLADSLTGESWQALLGGARAESVTVTMPEFEVSAHLCLNDALSALGITDAFGGSADFSRIGESDVGKLFLSSVQQKVLIEVSRHGTKAAAVTWGEMKTTSVAEPIRVTLDRPFLYAVIENTTGIPLFLGTYSTTAD